MRHWLQRWQIAHLVEVMPSMLFLALLRSGVNLELAGWIGSALSAAAMTGLRHFRHRHDPLMLGINVHLLLITPLIIGILRLGLHDVGGILVAHSYRSVLVTTFLVGCCLTLGSTRGFVGSSAGLSVERRVQSTILLAANALAILWAFSFAGSDLLAVGLPMAALFGLKRFLVRRAHSSDDRIQSGAAAGAGAALTVTSDPNAI